MASLWRQKDSPYWYIRFVDPNTGERVRRSTGTKDRKTAELILKDIEIKIAKGNFGLENMIPAKSIQDFGIEYLEGYSKINKSPKTCEIDKMALRNWVETIGNTFLTDVTARLVEKFKSEMIRKLSATTVNMRFRSLRAAFSVAVKWGYLQSNPFKGLKEIPVDGADAPRYLSSVEIKKLFAVVDDERFRTLFEFYINTGGRLREVLGLTWNDVNLENKTLTFRHETKFNKKRDIGLNRKAIELLQSVQAMSPGAQLNDRIFTFSAWYVSKRFKHYVRKAGLPESITTHSLRHTFASHLVMNGVNIYTVKELMGHSSLKVTEVYSHLSPAHKIKAVEKLKYD